MRVDSRPSFASSPVSVAGYTPAAEGASLAKGLSGPQVVELQNLLNAAGLQPPLKPDGLFGPKTEAALAKLTGSKVFDAAAQQVLAQRGASAGQSTDGFETSPRPTPPGAASAGPTHEATHVVQQGAPPPGSVADRTLELARGELGSVDPMKAGSDGRYVGWKHLQDIFEKTTGWRPTDAEMKSNKPGGKSWCGIFACHVLQEAGVNVKWDLTKGKMVGDVQQIMAPSFKDYRTYKGERQAFEASIKPGDVITLNNGSNHHAIVTKVNGDGTVETIDGNKPQIGEGHWKLADVTSYYRPTQS